MMAHHEGTKLLLRKGPTGIAKGVQSTTFCQCLNIPCKWFLCLPFGVIQGGGKVEESCAEQVHKNHYQSVMVLRWGTSQIVIPEHERCWKPLLFSSQQDQLEGEGGVCSIL